MGANRTGTKNGVSQDSRRSGHMPTGPGGQLFTPKQKRRSRSTAGTNPGLLSPDLWKAMRNSIADLEVVESEDKDKVDVDAEDVATDADTGMTDAGKAIKGRT
jgi:hypothetical protein